MSQSAAQAWHSNRKFSEQRTCGDGVSFAEWRFETGAGNEAFACGEHETAAMHFDNAARIAERLAALARLGGADADCAVRALISARRNIAQNSLRLGFVDEAGSVLETMFLQLCAIARSPGSALQEASARQIYNAAESLLVHLENNFASPGRLLAVQAIAHKTIALSQKKPFAT